MVIAHRAQRSILYIITDLDVGGVPLHLMRLAIAMQSEGYEVTVVSLKPFGPVADQICQHGIEAISCNTTSPWDASVVLRLRNIIVQRKPDIIHAFLFHANNAARIAAQLAGYPAHQVLTEIQTVEIERSWHLLVDHFMASLSRCTIVNAPGVYHHLRRAASIPSNKLHLIRSGVALDRFDQVPPVPRSSLGVREDAKLMMWHGRMDPIKGLPILLEAHHRLLLQGERLTLLLVGDGPQREVLERECQQRGIQHAVVFTGFRGDIPNLLATADLYVFPSFTEGLPNSLLEAMASGLPIVASDIAGCRDLISHGEQGLLVPAGDATRWADAIARLLRQRDVAGKLGENARNAVREHWSHEQMLNAYRALYDPCG